LLVASLLGVNSFISRHRQSGAKHGSMELTIVVIISDHLSRACNPKRLFSWVPSALVIIGVPACAIPRNVDSGKDSVGSLKREHME
jgi:hypothetical protein